MDNGKYLEISSNNTNKLSPQEHAIIAIAPSKRSNNTNKLSPQERPYRLVLI